MTTTATWNDPEHCPFCGETLPTPGVGFIDHIDESPDCKSGFDAWRTRIAGDICGGWSG